VKKQAYCVYIEEDIHNKIKDISEKENRSFSQQINKILRDYLNLHGIPSS